MLKKKRRDLFMKKLSFVLIVTLLLSLCSCAPAPNGKQIFDIKDPQSVELTLLPALALSAFSPDRFQTLLQEPADITAICELLNELTLTEVGASGVVDTSGVFEGISIVITCAENTRSFRIAGTSVYCHQTDKAYRADRDITNDLTAYLTREVGTVSSGQDLFQTDKISRITITNSQWEEVEMTDITPAVEALSGLTLTHTNTPRLEGGLHATIHLQDGSIIGITFGGDLMQINNKMYQVDRNISDLFSAVIHP
jgi:hypothetical protein